MKQRRSPIAMLCVLFAVFPVRSKAEMSTDVATRLIDLETLTNRASMAAGPVSAFVIERRERGERTRLRAGGAIGPGFAGPVSHGGLLSELADPTKPVSPTTYVERATGPSLDRNLDGRSPFGMAVGLTGRPGLALALLGGGPAGMVPCGIAVAEPHPTVIVELVALSSQRPHPQAPDEWYLPSPPIGASQAWNVAGRGRWNLGWGEAVLAFGGSAARHGTPGAFLSLTALQDAGEIQNAVRFALRSPAYVSWTGEVPRELASAACAGLWEPGRWGSLSWRWRYTVKPEPGGFGAVMPGSDYYAVNATARFGAVRLRLNGSITGSWEETGRIERRGLVSHTTRLRSAVGFLETRLYGRLEADGTVDASTGIAGQATLGPARLELAAAVGYCNGGYGEGRLRLETRLPAGRFSVSLRTKRPVPFPTFRDAGALAGMLGSRISWSATMTTGSEPQDQPGGFEVDRKTDDVDDGGHERSGHDGWVESQFVDEQWGEGPDDRGEDHHENEG